MPRSNALTASGPNLTRPHQSIILALLVASALGGCTDGSDAHHATGEPSTAVLSPGSERVRAVVLDAREAPGDSALIAIRDLGASHIALVSFGFQEAIDEPSIRFSPDVRWYSESGDGARELARRAADLGMGLILKPQIWVRGGAWTADIGFGSEAEWRRWEEDYRRFLLHTARIAEELDADILVIGTELANPVRRRPAYWRDLAAEVRRLYHGKLTYGANWHDDYLHVPFWEELDYIGVQAYFPLADTDRPSPEALRRGWSGPARSLETLSARLSLPVLFTEIGYRSVGYAAREPWTWPSRDERATPDPHLQRELFSAFFESMWDRPWFAGAVIWKLYPQDSRRARRRELDFTPQGKPAEAVIRRWFSGQ